MHSLSPARGVAYALGAIIALAIPATSLAATYAYVNTSGIIATTSAADAISAMTFASNISTHSGVALIDESVNWSFIGERVPGM